MDSDIFLLFQKEKLKQEMVRQHAKIHAVSTLLNQDLKPVVTVSLPATYPGTSPLSPCPCSSLPAAPLPASHSSPSQLFLIVQVLAKGTSLGKFPLTTVSKVLPPCPQSLSQHPSLHPVTAQNYLLRYSLALLTIRIASIIYYFVPRA